MFYISSYVRVISLISPLSSWDRVVSGLSAAEAKIKKILINTKLIYPPPATDRVFALGEARPEVDRAAQEFATKA